MLNLFAESTTGANMKSTRDTSALLIIEDELEAKVVINKTHQNQIKR